MNVVEIERGTSPVILTFPHAGTGMPPDIREKLDANGLLLADTDWHLHTLYAELLPAATTVRATFHRYVIDANRDPAGSSLYPGCNTTDLLPATDFDGKPIWRDGQAPSEADIPSRLAGFHARYHAALTAEIERVKQMHGVAVLYDCHSIRSHLPFLFEGCLPDFNVGAGNGRTCSPILEQAVVEVVRSAAGYTNVLNGRFKGGWTTRHYGQPANRIHAIQMELAQSTYLSAEAPPYTYDQTKARTVRAHLKTILEQIERITPNLKSS